MERLTTDKPVGEMGMYELAHNCCYIEGGKARYRDYEMDIDARELARELIRQHEGYNLPEDDEAFDEEIMEAMQGKPEIYVDVLIALFYRSIWAMAELRERLKPYEDLEITAEQVCQIDKAYTELCTEFGKYKKLEERLNNIFDGQLTLEDVVEGLEHVVLEPGSPHPVNAKVLTHAEAAEWDKYQGLKEQRMIPPCNVGDVIWDIDFGEPWAYKVTGYSYGNTGRFDEDTETIDEISIYCEYLIREGIARRFTVSEIGKTVFLTREAAEQALKEMENANGQREKH